MGGFFDGVNHLLTLYPVKLGCGPRLIAFRPGRKSFGLFLPELGPRLTRPFFCAKILPPIRASRLDPEPS
jgi:hypothetical protein